MKLIGENFLQGKVDFRSEIEEGTTFYLELPEAPAV
jgi:signal transduction histidine kinase